MSENILKEIAQEYSKIDSVYAVVLAGSRTAMQSDENSDYDIYVYTNKEISIEFRTELAKKYANDYEINNQYFETGDEWTLKDGKTCFDFMLRCPNWISDTVENIWVKHHASLGYTTCFMHNIISSKILYDKNDWFLNLQNKLKTPYPVGLKNNIIKKNLPLLKDKPNGSYLAQIELAVKREDAVSVNHRISAFLASYFDIIMAVNEKFHPGEKRLLSFSKKNCSKLPEDFEENLLTLLKTENSKKVEILNVIVDNLKKILP